MLGTTILPKPMSLLLGVCLTFDDERSSLNFIVGKCIILEKYVILETCVILEKCATLESWVCERDEDVDEVIATKISWRG